MPSTYTVNLGIEKPATGEQSGTWGDTTNTNFDILDQGINGAVRITLTSAGSSGSPNALTITNGAASNGRNKWIEFYSSGDLGGNVFVQLDPNDAEKIVFVRNSLAGSRTVLLFQGTYNSGRDLEVPAGVDMVVKFDGGGASAATVTNVYNNLKVTGLVAGTADINGGTIDGTVIGGAAAAALTATTVVASTSLNIASDGATVTGIKDEDNMSSNSATKLATQQSIKAYVDSQVGTVDTLAEILANGNDTGSNNIDVDGAQKVQFRDSAIFINSSTNGQLDIVADNEIQIAATTIDINGAIVASGDISAASLDISGNVDIDGILNVDAIDIDGAVQLDATLTVGVDDTGYDVKFFGAAGGSFLLWDESANNLSLAGASTLNVAGVLTANAGIVVDSIAIDGNAIDCISGDLTLDVAGDIILDADGSTITFKDGGTTRFNFNLDATPDFVMSGGNASITAATQDAGFTIIGNDGGNDINALSFDMSAAGAATFNSTVKAGGTVLATAAALVNSTSAGGFGFASNNTAFYSFGANTSTAGSYTFQNLSSNASVNVTSLSLSSTGAVFNEGSVDADFRVESNGNTHMLFVDGGNNRVGVGTSAPATQLDVHGTSAKINIRDLTSAATGVGGAISFQGFTSGTGSPNNFGKISGTKASGNVGGVLTLATSATNGTMTDRMTISESGNLGIGVAPILLSGNAAPGLTVASNGPFIILKDANNANSCNYIANNSGVMQFGLNADDGGTKVEIAQFGTFGAVFNENSLDLNFRVESNGNANMLFVDGGGDGVGIGTATAGNSTLEVRSTGVDGTFANAIGFQYSGNASEANTISTSVSSTATNSGFKFNVSDGGGSAGKTSVLKITRADMVVNDDSNDYDFRVESDAESNAFTVDGETGQVGVGSRRGFRFGNGNLQGNAGSSGGGYPTIGYNIKFGGTAGQFGTLAQDTSWRMDIGNNNRLQVHSRSSSTAVDANATYTAGPFVSLNGTSWTSSSDARLKENISTITGALDKVKAMRPVNYTWIHDGEGASNQLGFIAQEMAFIVPEVVDIPEDDEVHQGITYEKLVPVLTAALQEALTKIETLETRLTALENA